LQAARQADAGFKQLVAKDEALLKEHRDARGRLEKAERDLNEEGKRIDFLERAGRISPLEAAREEAALKQEIRDIRDQIQANLKAEKAIMTQLITDRSNELTAALSVGLAQSSLDSASRFLAADMTTYNALKCAQLGINI
jgi:hypothetical protein